MNHALKQLQKKIYFFSTHKKPIGLTIKEKQEKDKKRCNAAIRIGYLMTYEFAIVVLPKIIEENHNLKYEDRTECILLG